MGGLFLTFAKIGMSAGTELNAPAAVPAIADTWSRVSTSPVGETFLP
jgi:hypothetical protein